MIDPSRKQAALCTRATYQLQEIETACRQVTALSRELGSFSAEVASSEVNCRKVEILKNEIRDRLREYAGTMDAIYQLFDRKIQLILAEVKKNQIAEPPPPHIPTPTLCRKCQSATASNPGERSEKGQASFDSQFSETLNPRIMRLESKISEYQVSEMKLRGRIAELQVKNEALLDEFNRLSTASNKKINELSSRLSKDSSLSDPLNISPTKKDSPAQAPLQFTPSKRKINPVQFDTEQSHERSYASDSVHREDRSRLLNFGCMPSRSPKAGNSLNGSLAREECEKMDRHDRNRRFDLLLNKLRGSQQESTEGSHVEEMRRLDEHTVYSPVHRHQI